MQKNKLESSTFKKMTDEEYFASEGINNSFLIQFDRSPAHALTGIEKTKAMGLGTILHKFVLENEFFYKTYVIAPEGMMDRRLKEYKAFANEHEGKEIILYSDLQELEQIKQNIDNYILEDNISIAEVFCESQSEIAFFWEEEINGKNILRKGKADKLYLGEDYNICFDVKKVENCLTFWRSVRDYRLDRQAATYIDGITALTQKPTHFYFLSVEMTAPFGVKCYQLDESIIHNARVENLNSIMKWQDWRERGSKPELYPNGIETIYKI